MQPNTVDYVRVRHRPKRRWLPPILLLAAAVVWYWPRLTPTGFPNLLDLATLGVLVVGAFAAGYWCEIPCWATLGFGGLAVGLFLLANFNDNNFRANTGVADVLLPWSLYVTVGATVARAASFLGRQAAR